MKKIIWVSLILLAFLLANIFTIFRTILITEMESDTQGSKVIIEREVEIWGLKYNPIWYEAFR